MNGPKQQKYSKIRGAMIDQSSNSLTMSDKIQRHKRQQNKSNIEFVPMQQMINQNCNEIQPNALSKDSEVTIEMQADSPWKMHHNVKPMTSNMFDAQMNEPYQYVQISPECNNYRKRKPDMSHFKNFKSHKNLQRYGTL